MNLSEESKRSLRLFIETVAELEESSLYKNLLGEEGITYRYSWREGQPASQEIVNLDEEQLKSFILTARLLSQDNDGRSIRVVAQIFDGELQNHQLYPTFNGIRWKLNDYLDQEYPIKIQGVSITSRHLFDIFLYGHYAHRNPDKEDVYCRWESDWITFPHYKLGFLLSLSVLFSCAHQIRSVVERIFNESEQEASPNSES